MKKNIENLFSPEKIRKNWKKDSSKASKVDNKDKEIKKHKEDDIVLKCKLLKKIASQRYLLNQYKKLDSVISVLQKNLEKRSDLIKNGEEIAEINKKINELLNQIEDLMFGYDIKNKKK